MTQPDKLTIEEVERRLKFSQENPEISPLGSIWQQLADTMRENERLREALEKIAKPALGGKQQQYMAQEALSYKDSDD